MRKAAPKTPKPKASAVLSVGRCVCGAVSLEIDLPAVWAWHDHSAASRHAQGAAYATYVGSWKSRFRILVFDGGRIVEEGKHGELAAKGGAYARLLAVAEGTA